MKKIFVTGGTGFIGRVTINLLKDKYDCYALTRSCNQKEDGIVFVKGDIADERQIKRILNDIRPDVLLHLAWNVKGYDYANSIENHKWVKWSTRLVEGFLESGGKQVICAGSCLEYDVRVTSAHSTDEKCSPDSLYGKCKLETYKAIGELCDKYEARFVWGRIFFPYGKGEEKRKFISSAIESLKCNEEFICSSPNSIIDYIHVEDIANMFACVVEDDGLSGIVNICSGKGIKISAILDIIKQKIRSKCNIRYNTGSSAVVILGEPSLSKYICKYDMDRGISSYFE